MPDSNQTGTPDYEKKTIGVVGLGYVGLPLAVAFAKERHRVVGFDVDDERIAALRNCVDRTGEVREEELRYVEGSVTWSRNPKILASPEIIIVAVPTPVDRRNIPDLSLLEKACEFVGMNLTRGTIVVFESTVYPGCTEEFCIPILEKYSGRKEGEDFHVAYSPERVNPGDKEHGLGKITKVVGSPDREILKELILLYGEVAGSIFGSPSIRVCEAAKAIENAQRDINIAFVNELAMMFSRMGIRTEDVLAAARTKWNFLDFRPGLVGGHCIGVDPYYLAHRAQEFGFHPEVILAGRRVNESVAPFIASRVMKSMKNRRRTPIVLVMGITFKENCPDTRNSKADDLIRELNEFGCAVMVFDPFVRPKFTVDYLYAEAKALEYDAIVVAVAHDSFRDLDWEKLKHPNAPAVSRTVVFDAKNIVPNEYADLRL